MAQRLGVTLCLLLVGLLLAPVALSTEEEQIRRSSSSNTGTVTFRGGDDNVPETMWDRKPEPIFSLRIDDAKRPRTRLPPPTLSTTSEFASPQSPAKAPITRNEKDEVWQSVQVPELGSAQVVTGGMEGRWESREAPLRDGDPTKFSARRTRSIRWNMSLRDRDRVVDGAVPVPRRQSTSDILYYYGWIRQVRTVDVIEIGGGSSKKSKQVTMRVRTEATLDERRRSYDARSSWWVFSSPPNPPQLYHFDAVAYWYFLTTTSEQLVDGNPVPGARPVTTTFQFCVTISSDGRATNPKDWRYSLDVELYKVTGNENGRITTVIRPITRNIHKAISILGVTIGASFENPTSGPGRREADAMQVRIDRQFPCNFEMTELGQIVAITTSGPQDDADRLLRGLLQNIHVAATPLAEEYKAYLATKGGKPDPQSAKVREFMDAARQAVHNGGVEQKLFTIPSDDSKIKVDVKAELKLQGKKTASGPAKGGFEVDAFAGITAEAAFWDAKFPVLEAGYKIKYSEGKIKKGWMAKLFSLLTTDPDERKEIVASATMGQVEKEMCGPYMDFAKAIFVGTIYSNSDKPKSHGDANKVFGDYWGKILTPSRSPQLYEAGFQLYPWGVPVYVTVGVRGSVDLNVFATICNTDKDQKAGDTALVAAMRFESRLFATGSAAVGWAIARVGVSLEVELIGIALPVGGSYLVNKNTACAGFQPAITSLSGQVDAFMTGFGATASLNLFKWPSAEFPVYHTCGCVKMSEKNGKCYGNKLCNGCHPDPNAKEAERFLSISEYAVSPKPSLRHTFRMRHAPAVVAAESP